MAYCEVAERDCEYLEVLEGVDTTLLLGEDDKRPSPEFGEAIEKANSRFRPASEGTYACSYDHCGVIKRAIIKTVLAEAHTIRETGI